MIDRLTWTLASWSVRAYPVILRVYPEGFRREFGESMTQLFRDLARDTCRRSGLGGLMALWLRAFIDILRSVVDAYASERRAVMFKAVVAAGVLWGATLVIASGYAAIRFDEFYNPPEFSRFSTTGPADEDGLISAYEQALSGEFGRYRAFAFGAGLLLAVPVGLASALFGLWQKSILHGAGALLAGTVVTVAAFELLPTIWFPFDRYPVGALWVMGGGLLLAAGVWLVVTAIGRYWPASRRFTTA